MGGGGDVPDPVPPSPPTEDTADKAVTSLTFEKRRRQMADLGRMSMFRTLPRGMAPGQAISTASTARAPTVLAPTVAPPPITYNATAQPIYQNGSGNTGGGGG